MFVVTNSYFDEKNKNKMHKTFKLKQKIISQKHRHVMCERDHVRTAS